MNNSARPFPSWLKWVCLILGGILLLGSLPGLGFAGLHFWVLAHSKEGLLANNGTSLAAATGQLVGSLLIFCVGLWLVKKPGQSARKETLVTESVKLEAAPAAPAPVVVRPVKVAKRNVHSCNVLQVGPSRRQIWQFDARNGNFELGREQSAGEGEPLASGLISKTWRSLWQPKLNIAWLPAAQVFLRVIQLPKSNFAETCSMVEFQLEKLSPIPVTQVVWTLHILPQSSGELQTIVVVLAEREVVEQFLGELEGQGFLADRLEIPLLDQLEAVANPEDGAWVHPIAQGDRNAALLAWWHKGVLQSLNLLSLPEIGDKAESLRAQLSQIMWGGELEGWIAETPAWHLAADEAAMGEWETVLRAATDAPVRIVASPPLKQLAGLTARRAASSETTSGLLPQEFLIRYAQQFHDRLWMRGLGAVLAVYVVGVIIYLITLGVFGWQTQNLEDKARNLAFNYTNVMQLEARLEVLKDREALKTAALDCWKAVAETLPGELQLEGFSFSEGKKVMLNGTAPDGAEKAILDFTDELKKSKGADGQPLFDLAKAEPPNYSRNPGGGLGWRFTWDLKRGELQ